MRDTCEKSVQKRKKIEKKYAQHYRKAIESVLIPFQVTS
jgi:hypothetical protein